jgi:hypothetical protein
LNNLNECLKKQCAAALPPAPSQALQVVVDAHILA